MSEKKDFVSINFKYWRHSKAVGLFAHSERLFQKNKNVLDPSLSEHNFGTSRLKNEYQTIHQLREQVKKARNDANTLIEGVLSLSGDRFRELEKKLSEDQIRDKFDKQMMVLVRKIEKKYKFTFVGYQFHLDEYHLDKKGDKKINYHAHVFFYNYDFETNTSPLRKMKLRDWSTIQDLCGFSFQPWSFRRGLNKKITKREHLEKDEFIKYKQDQALGLTSKIVSNFKKTVKAVFDFDNNGFKQGLAKFHSHLEELKQFDEAAYEEVSSITEKIIPSYKTRRVKNGKIKRKLKPSTSKRG